MRALTATEVLGIWERGMGQPSPQRAITLLGPVCAESPERLAQLPIGRRDCRLLALREHTFGPQVTSLCECPECRERIEFEFDVADVRGDSETELAEIADAITVRHDGFEVTCRLPNTADLVAVRDAGDAHRARQQLFESCLLSARNQSGDQIPSSALPEELSASVAARMAEADPQGEVELAVICPHCDHRWTPLFDIAGFFWIEVEAYAQRLLREVHELASNYGWREADILHLSAARRQAYLELIRA